MLQWEIHRIDNMIDIQDISDQTLFRVISEGDNISWNFFALKVVIARLKLKLSVSGVNEETIQQCCTDLRELFRKSSNISNAKKDLQIIVEQFAKNETAHQFLGQTNEILWKSIFC